MTEFERATAKAFEKYADGRAVDLRAYRQKQHRFSTQLCDVTVDSQDTRFYLAIECKSVKSDTTNKLYFSTHFSTANGRHQLDRMKSFLEDSGRTGVIAVEIKNGRGYKREGYIVPFRVFYGARAEGKKGVSLERIRSFTEMERKEGGYRLPESTREILEACF